MSESATGALQNAQDTIVAQEKYNQAKDIAGGFAHEIRNALFPVRSALNKLNTADSLIFSTEKQLKEF